MFSRLMAAFAVLLFVSAATVSSELHAQDSTPADGEPPALTFLAPYYLDEAERYARRLAEQDPVAAQSAMICGGRGRTPWPKATQYLPPTASAPPCASSPMRRICGST